MTLSQICLSLYKSNFKYSDGTLSESRDIAQELIRMAEDGIIKICQDE